MVAVITITVVKQIPLAIPVRLVRSKSLYKFGSSEIHLETLRVMNELIKMKEVVQAI